MTNDAADRTLNLSTILSSPHEQPLYVAIAGFAYGTGCLLGPIVGGALPESGETGKTWRLVRVPLKKTLSSLADCLQAFLLNLFVFLLTFHILLFKLPSLPRRPEASKWELLQNMDWLGTLLSLGLYGTFTVAFASGGALWAYSDSRTVILIAVCAVCTFAFAVTQRYSVWTSPIDRLFPGDFLADPQLILLYIIMACGGAALFVSLYYIPLYFLFVHGDTGIGSAVRLLPFICPYVASVLLCGAVMGRTGYHVVWFVFSGLCLTAGGACMYMVTRDTPVANIYGYTVLLGLGMMTSQAGYAVGNRIVRQSRAAELIQYLNMSQWSSQLIGLALASAIFQSQVYEGVKVILSPLGYTDQDIQLAVAGTRSNLLWTVTPDVRDQCLHIIVRSISRCWVLVMVAGALQTLCSLFLTKSRWVPKHEDAAESTSEGPYP